MRGYTKLYDNTNSRFVKWFSGAEKSKMFQGKNRDGYIKLFQTLLIKASWQDTNYEQNGRSFEIKKGEVITKYEDLSKASNLTISQVRVALERFENDGAIVSPKGIHGVGKTIFIVNYTEYQEKHKEHPNKHYYCPEAIASKIQENPKQQKFEKVAEVLKSSNTPPNKLKTLIDKLTNEPSLIDKLLLILDIIENKNNRSLAELSQKFSRSLAEVSDLHINNARAKDKKIKRVKEKESKKKNSTPALTNFFLTEEKEETKEDPTLEKNFTQPKYEEQTEELPQEIIKAYLLATEKITKDTVGPFKTQISEAFKSQVINFFKEKNLTEDELIYLFKSAVFETKLHSKPENRDRHYSLGYFFAKISDITTNFFNKTMEIYKKEQDKLTPKENLTYNLEITEEIQDLNERFNKTLQDELGYKGSFYYNKVFANQIVVGGYDDKNRIVRIHFSSLLTYQHFTIHLDYKMFLLKFFKVKNIVMLPCFSPSKIIRWQVSVQGDLFAFAKSQEEIDKLRERAELEARKRLIADYLLTEEDNHQRFGYILKIYEGKEYQAFCSNIRM